MDTVFISYAGKGEDCYKIANHCVKNTEEGITRYTSVDSLSKQFESRNVLYSRDIKDIKGGSIPKYIREVGEAKTVVIYLSDKYFISPHCMMEWDLIHRDSEIKDIKYIYYLKEEIYTKGGELLFKVGSSPMRKYFNDYLDKCIKPFWQNWFNDLQQTIEVNNIELSDVDAYACNGDYANKKLPDTYEDAYLFKETFKKIPSILEKYCVVKDNYFTESQAAFDVATWLQNKQIQQHSPNSCVNSDLPCDLVRQNKSNRDIPRDSDVEDVADKLDKTHVVNIIGIGGCGKSTVARLFVVGNNYIDKDPEFNENKNKYNDGFQNSFSEITDIIINTNNVYKEFCDRFVVKHKICNFIYSTDKQPDYEETFKSILEQLQNYKTVGDKKNLFVMDVNETANYKSVKEIIGTFMETCSANWKLLVVSRECLCDREDDYVDISQVDKIDSDFIRRLFFDRLKSDIRPYYQRKDTEELETVFSKLGNLPILIRALAEYLNAVNPMEVSAILEKLGDGNLTEELKCRSLNKEKVYENIGNFMGKLSIFKNLGDDIQKQIVRTMMLWDADYFSQTFIKQVVFNNLKVEGFVSALNTLVDKCWLDCQRDKNYNLEYKMHSLIAENSRRQVFEDDDNIKYRDFSSYLKNIESIDKSKDKERNALCKSLLVYDLTTDADSLLRLAHNFQNSEIYERALKIKLLKLQTPNISDAEIFNRFKSDTLFNTTPVDELYYSWLKDAPGYKTVLKHSSFAINGNNYKMISIPNGEFLMGAQKEFKTKANYDKDAESNEAPVHKVKLDSYFLAETQVTQGLWKDVMQGKIDDPSLFPSRSYYAPIDNVSWYDCLAFIMELNEQTKLKFRLPSEAEWEYAARGGCKSHGCKYSGSNTLSDVAWYGYYDNYHIKMKFERSFEIGARRLLMNWTDEAYPSPMPIRQRYPNELGIYDMSGNVWEWCHDWYGQDYYQQCLDSSKLSNNPQGPDLGSRRILRGGSWDAKDHYCRVSYRNSDYPCPQSYSAGFRLALSVPKDKS